MKIVLLKHLKLQIIERNIPEGLVKETLLAPDMITGGKSGTKVAQRKYFDKLKDKEYLVA